MSEYLPFRFCNKVKSILVFPGIDKKKAALLNMISYNFINKLTDSADMIHDAVCAFLWTKDNGGTDIYKEFPESIIKAHRRYVQALGLVYSSSSAMDFADNVTQVTVAKHWLRTKTVYRLEPSLMLDLMEMEAPKTILTKWFRYLPTSCFYIDYNDCDFLIEHSKGCFIDFVDMGEKGIDILILDTFEKDGKFAIVHSARHIDILPDTDDETEVKIGTTNNYEHNMYLYGLDMSVEIDEAKVTKFITNFLMYLNADNRDIEYVNKTKSETPEKPSNKKAKKQKDDQAEEYNVGYRISTPITFEQRKRYRYIDENGNPVKPDKDREKRSYSSNYRPAHWQRFRTGSKSLPLEQRPTVVHWVQGVFVKGNNNKEMQGTIHDVKNPENKDQT